MQKNIDKNIIIAFDDGRKDVYDNAYKIMKKYSLVGSFYVITGSLDDSYIPKTGFKSGKKKFVTLENLLEMKKNGFEISSHSNNHTNDYDMIESSIKKLCNYKLMEKNFLSFSSPKSEINEKNYLDKNLKNLNLKYLRTGVQVRNESIYKKILFIIQKYIKSKLAFYLLNKENIMSSNKNNFFIKTIAIRSYNTIGQLEYLIKKIKNGQTAVLLFHSIVDSKDCIDEWGYSFNKFEKLCQFVSENKEYKNITVKQFVTNTLGETNE